MHLYKEKHLKHIDIRYIFKLLKDAREEGISNGEDTPPYSYFYDLYLIANNLRLSSSIQVEKDLLFNILIASIPKKVKHKKHINPLNDLSILMSSVSSINSLTNENFKQLRVLSNGIKISPINKLRLLSFERTQINLLHEYMSLFKPNKIIAAVIGLCAGAGIFALNVFIGALISIVWFTFINGFIMGLMGLIFSPPVNPLVTALMCGLIFITFGEIFAGVIISMGFGALLAWGSVHIAYDLAIGLLNGITKNLIRINSPLTALIKSSKYYVKPAFSEPLSEVHDDSNKYHLSLLLANGKKLHLSNNLTQNVLDDLENKHLRQEVISKIVNRLGRLDIHPENKTKILLKTFIVTNKLYIRKFIKVLKQNLSSDEFSADRINTYLGWSIECIIHYPSAEKELNKLAIMYLKKVIDTVDSPASFIYDNLESSELTHLLFFLQGNFTPEENLTQDIMFHGDEPIIFEDNGYEWANEGETRTDIIEYIKKFEEKIKTGKEEARKKILEYLIKKIPNKPDLKQSSTKPINNETTPLLDGYSDRNMVLTYT